MGIMIKRIPPKNTKLYRLYEYILNYYNSNRINLLDKNDLLTDEQTDMLYLYFVEGKTLQEIGEKYGVVQASISLKMIGRKNSILSKLIYWTNRKERV